MDPHRQRNVAVAADEFLTAMFPAPPHLGWNVRALQDWALVATDDTETERPAMAAELLARVADVAPGSVAQAAASLRSFTGADRTSVSRASEAGPKTSARRPGPRHPPTGAELAL
jgi:hypothetical protein